MTYKTHFVGGLALTGVACVGLHATPQAVLPMMVVSGFSALLPDLDMPNSKASRYGVNRLVAYPLNKLFGHRGFIHSPLLCAAITLLLYLLHCPMWLWVGFGLGFLSHLVLDTLNPSGIPWLWPCKKRFHVLGIKTNTWPEYGLLAAMAVMLVPIFTAIIKKGG